jgi:xylulose-5-phosphate/fructose-6-phosphate phosphoketolase
MKIKTTNTKPLTPGLLRKMDAYWRATNYLSVGQIYLFDNPTRDKPIIFAFHGYPWLIHRLTYRRTNHRNLHVRGYKDEGTTTTPSDMVVLNDLDRFHLVGDVVDRVPSLEARAAYAKQLIRDKLIDHKNYVCKYGEDMPEVRNWKWRAK